MEANLARNLTDIVQKAFCHAPPARALVLYDRHSALAMMLAAGYRTALPHGSFVDFDAHTHAEVLAILDALSPGDLVVLVQSTRFDIREFRFRLELFRRGLAVIEHPHVGRMPPEEVAAFVDCLAYDPTYYRPLGRALKAHLDAASVVELHSRREVLRYEGPFEDSKLNVGDYRGMANTGGQFPIGEVFTEPVDVTGVNGKVELFAFGDNTFSVHFLPEPFVVRIEAGRVVDAVGAPPAFLGVLEDIRAAEGEVWVRELGFGLNRAFTRERRVTDVGTYERMCGVHLSFGAKHPVYAKAGFSKKHTRFHVDVFVDAQSVVADGVQVFDGERYTV